MYAEIQDNKLPSLEHQVEQEQTQDPDDSHIPSYADMMGDEQEEFQPTVIFPITTVPPDQKDTAEPQVTTATFIEFFSTNAIAVGNVEFIETPTAAPTKESNKTGSINIDNATLQALLINIEEEASPTGTTSINRWQIVSTIKWKLPKRCANTIREQNS